VKAPIVSSVPYAVEVEQALSRRYSVRRLANDFETTIHSARAFRFGASVILLVPRIARA
jgi:hypothetical protein